MRKIARKLALNYSPTTCKYPFFERIGSENEKNLHRNRRKTIDKFENVIN